MWFLASRLSTLGCVVQDYKNLTMKFQVGSRLVELRGDNTTFKGHIQFQSLRRMLDTNAVLSCLTLQISDMATSLLHLPLLYLMI